jgi:hypothetical protein
MGKEIEDKTEKTPKYKEGDKLKVINYGHPIWSSKKEWQKAHESGLANEKPSNIIYETEDYYVWDMTPSVIGQSGIVKTAMVTHGVPAYSIDGIKGKSAWYDEQQLELVEID